MYSINDLRTFVAVARTGGLSAAARSMGISVATTSHRISKLEGALDASLFFRNNRSVRLTDEGQLFLERIEPILEDLRVAEHDAGRGAGKLRGHLRVTLSPWILSRFIMPALPRLLDENPALSIEFIAVDRYVSLVEEGVDCAIRVGVLPDSALMARKLCDNERILCAAPEFLESFGTPSNLAELSQCRWVCLPWQTRFEVCASEDSAAQITPTNRVTVSNSDSLTDAATQGIGVAVKSRLAVHTELKTGSLVEVMPGSLKSSDAPVAFVHAKGATVGRKTQAFGKIAELAFRSAK